MTFKALQGRKRPSKTFIRPCKDDHKRLFLPINRMWVFGAIMYMNFSPDGLLYFGSGAFEGFDFDNCINSEPV